MNSNSLDPVISIGTLAKKVGLSVSAIRKYEEQGLLMSHRTHSGHRLFSYEDIQRVKNIQHLIKELGFNFEGIRRMQAILPCWDLLPCEKKEQETCLAVHETSKPCWMIKEAHCTLKSNECRKCLVYRFGSMFTKDLKDLIHKKRYDKDQRSRIKELLNEN